MTNGCVLRMEERGIISCCMEKFQFNQQLCDIQACELSSPFDALMHMDQDLVLIPYGQELKLKWKWKWKMT